MKQLLSLIAALSLAAPVFAQEAAKPPLEFKTPPAAFELKDGDTFVFLGDSITHQCLYTQYVEDFYYTRFPNLRIRFYNSGVSGDRADDALIRFEEDLAKFRPKWVTILLGMNDGGGQPFNADIFARYEKDMTKLFERLAEIGATAVPMTPTMYDARASRMSKKGGQEPKDTYYNSTLAYYGAWLREEASVRGLGFVDMYSPLNAVATEERKLNSKFTVIADAVHPGAPGQVIMAAAVINDMAPKGPVSAIRIVQQPDGKGVQNAVNGRISEFQGGDKIAFTFTANALPWVLPAEAALGYKLAKAGHRLSNEKITVGNLVAGNYNLSIDGQIVGTYTEAQLASGVELEENAKTPQYQQALKVALLNKDRNDKAMRLLRNAWRGKKDKRSELAWLEQNPTHADFATRKAAYDKWDEEFKVNIAKFEALAKDYEDQIYQSNKPLPRKYEITRAE